MVQKLEMNIYLYANQFHDEEIAFGNERYEESESHIESISFVPKSSLSRMWQLAVLTQIVIIFFAKYKV